jgi:hypothetical protein
MLLSLRHQRRFAALVAPVLFVALALGVAPGHAAGLPPVAVGDQYSAEVNSALSIAAPGLLTNDQHPEGLAFWVSAYIPARHGVLSEFYADGRFTYTPNPDFVGVDIFYYQVTDTDGLASHDFATVTIYVGVPVGDDLLENGSFETPDASNLRLPNAWRIVKPTNDARVCPSSSGAPAQDGLCTFRFTGSKNERALLMQSLAPEHLSVLAVGDTLTATLYARTQKAARPTAVAVVVTYADSALGANGVEKQVVRVPAGTTSWWFYRTPALALRGAATDVRIRVTHTGWSGRVWVDNAQLVLHESDAVAAAGARVPLPGAPLPAWVAAQPVPMVAATD